METKACLDIQYALDEVGWGEYDRIWYETVVVPPVTNDTDATKELQRRKL